MTHAINSYYAAIKEGYSIGEALQRASDATGLPRSMIADALCDWYQ